MTTSDRELQDLDRAAWRRVTLRTLRKFDELKDGEPIIDVLNDLHTLKKAEKISIGTKLLVLAFLFMRLVFLMALGTIVLFIADSPKAEAFGRVTAMFAAGLGLLVWGAMR